MANTRQIRRVTGTLQRVSAARLPGDRQAIENSSLYTDGLAFLVRNLRAVAPGADHPYLREAGGGAALVVVFGSERGLCGGFNGSLVERFGELTAGYGGRPVRVVAVGKIVNRRLRRMGAAVDLFVPQPSPAKRREFVDRIFDFLDDGYRKGLFGTADILQNVSVSPFRQETALTRLLPVARESGTDPEFARSAFEPVPQRILAGILAEYARQMLDNAFLKSIEAEDAARQAAMSRATENAGKILEDLRRRYSRLRQENITTEMIELAGGGAQRT